MTRLNRLVRGVVALGLLAALVIGIPWALWHFIGWPLPHGVPSWGQLHRGLDQHGILDQVLVKALAAVVWITWAVLVVSVAVEVPAAVAGRSARQLRVVGLFQPLTGRLLAAVIFAVLALAPRAGHEASPGSLAGLVSSGANRPVLTMLVKSTLADASFPMPTSSGPTASVAGAVAMSASAPTPAVATTTYVVQRGDTLWGIAERQLGNPLLWSEILELNEGRSQPGGLTLTDPHWIDPGWTLLLPGATDGTDSGAGAAQSPSPVVSPSTTPTRATAPTAAPAVPPLISPTDPAPPSRSAPTPTIPEVAPPSSGPATTRLSSRSSNEPVRLPSGSVVGASFAAGVLSAVALGRLRRRHTYRYRAPGPGRDISPEPPRPTLRHLVRRSAPDDDNVDDPKEIALFPVAPFDDNERHQNPGRVDIGTLDGATVTIEVAVLSGMAFVGASNDDVVRALLASMLVRAGPGAAEVLLTLLLVDQLLPGLGLVPAIRSVKGIDDVARIIETEMIARARRFEAVDASDASSFRTENPENPLPLLVALVDSLPDDSFGRWSALLEGAKRLGIAVLFLGANPVASGRLTTDESRTVTDVEPVTFREELMGSVLFGLRAGEAVELLGTVANSLRDEFPDDDVPIDASENEAIKGEITDVEPRSGGQLEEASVQASSQDERWPSEYVDIDGAPRPLDVRVLGTYNITAYGEPVNTGLRNRDKALLAWYLLRPEGATIDEAIEALWPDTSAGQAHKPFWRALGELRTRFRRDDAEALDVLTRQGEQYRLAGTETSCDLWDFQRAVGEAAEADNDEECRQALRRAVDTYAGDFLEGWDEPWIEVARQDLHRRCLDAHLRLAEIEDHDGEPEKAVATLEGAIELDRYAEEPYRRIMTLQAAQGHPDTVKATWKLLQSRLGGLDLDVEDATRRLYRSLIVIGDDPLNPPRPMRAA
jgi:DNA-binding SARP family transcriptional activator